ncbi:MAG: TatD family hydrolase [Chloroflexota bacterium]|nr:TatD family hydrolase [Chloroflexota bacterium]MDP6508623.1 TatD family hydrolase [Chloroflexota bacterium]MDP6758371.1 TatD family hydrolase [Chloroflexota bacterium]
MARLLFFDSHTHLNDEQFADDIAAVWERARNGGVTRALVLGFSLETSLRAVELAGRLEGLYAAVGIHPHSAEAADAAAMRRIDDLAAEPRVVAIGETGLDFSRGTERQVVQEAAFGAHLDLAVARDLPVIVHVRDAFDATLAVLQDYPGRGVIHCYTGDAAQLAGFLRLDLYISFAGVITYPSGSQAGEALKIMPGDRLLIETDSPHLAPQSRRGKRNEPVNLVETATRAAELRGIDLDDLAATTDRNAARLFGLDADQ